MTLTPFDSSLYPPDPNARLKSALRSLIEVAIKQLECIDGEFGSGLDFPELLLEGDTDAKAIQVAIEVLAEYEEMP